MVYVNNKKAFKGPVAYFLTEEMQNTPDGGVIILTEGGHIFKDTADHISAQMDESCCFKNDYLFETLSHLMYQTHLEERFASFNHPTSEEMALFLAQQYIIPVLRELEIIEQGIWRAVHTQHHTSVPIHVEAALGKYFKKQFSDLEEMQTRLCTPQKEEKKKDYSLMPFYANTVS